MMNTCLHQSNEYHGACYTLTVGMLPGEHVVVWRPFSPYHCLYLDPSDAVCMNNEHRLHAVYLFYYLVLLHDDDDVCGCYGVWWFGGLVGSGYYCIWRVQAGEPAN
jgi:hypothetical protein